MSDKGRLLHEGFARVLSIASLHLYPVKSLRSLEPEVMDLEAWGARGDRRWVVVDADGIFLTQRKDPIMATVRVLQYPNGIVLQHATRPDLRVPFPDGGPIADVAVWKDMISARDAGDEASLWLSAIIGKSCRLTYMDAPASARPGHHAGHDFQVSFADGFPLLVCTTASLQDLNTRLKVPVPMERFRPNIVIAGAAPWEEDSWVTLRIGDVELRNVKPCSRCVMTTIDQATGTILHKGEPLRSLGAFRRQEGGIMFGQNALVVRGGRIKLGDPVQLSKN
ncbi:MOSC domain-containing protein [Gluconobacter wancherniae]|nr:MOSC domain-containing protein [Gluconobacter wancherniae]